MVVQNYDVQTTSQRSYMSIKSSTMLAVNNLDAPSASSKLAQSNANKPNLAAGTNEEDTAILVNGKDKKPNNGLSLGHFKEKHKEIMDESIRYLAANSRAGTHRTSKSLLRGLHKGKTPSNPEELKMRMVELMFELISGKSSSTKSMTSENGTSMMSMQSESSAFSLSFFGNFFGISIGGSGGVDGAVRAGWRAESFEYESEQVSYTAQGVVNTADGRTINVDISMYMSRQFTSYMSTDIEIERRLCDPLVINYNGSAASLSGETFSFDLTSDGTMENLASLGAGSGFLALDKNGDGVINNGTELFGPNSGCGFSELREYDLDKNGWIDESDEVFDKLIVWTRDKDGNDTAYTLKELGIGAIYLGDIATEFSFKDETNQTLGVMRSTSFFLKEEGGAGTVSHIDLSV